MMAVVVTTGLELYDVQSSSQTVANNKTTPSFLQASGQMPFLSPNKPYQSTEGNNIIMYVVQKVLLQIPLSCYICFMDWHRR